MNPERQHLSRRHIDQLLQAIQSPPSSTLDSLAAWVRREIRPILAYRLLLCGVGTASGNTFIIRHVVRFGSGPPQPKNSTPRYRSVLQAAADCWSVTRRPILLTARDVASEKVRPKLANIPDLIGAPNIAIHGSSCGAAKISSIFVLAGSSEAILEDYAHVLYLLTPHLHTSLLHTLSAGHELPPAATLARTNSSMLTLREQQVHAWLRHGKTNIEIGRLLGISDKTAKTHVQAILAKLGVANRVQAAAIFTETPDMAILADDRKLLAEKI